MGGMRFRKLRIAWSAICAITCVVLVALWVRSYWWLDNVNFSTAGTTVVQSFNGSLAFVYSREISNPGLTTLSAKKLATLIKPIELRTKWPDWYFGSNQKTLTIRLPYWFVTLLPCVLAAVPWMRWRFTIRTLLIITTLVAALLGLAVWAASN